MARGKSQSKKFHAILFKELLEAENSKGEMASKAFNKTVRLGWVQSCSLEPSDLGSVQGLRAVCDFFTHGAHILQGR